MKKTLVILTIILSTFCSGNLLSQTIIKFNAFFDSTLVNSPLYLFGNDWPIEYGGMEISIKDTNQQLIFLDTLFFKIDSNSVGTIFQGVYKKSNSRSFFVDLQLPTYIAGFIYCRHRLILKEGEENEGEFNLIKR